MTQPLLPLILLYIAPVGFVLSLGVRWIRAPKPAALMLVAIGVCALATLNGFGTLYGLFDIGYWQALSLPIGTIGLSVLVRSILEMSKKFLITDVVSFAVAILLYAVAS